MSDNTKQKKVRTLSPEQLEKMKLARTAKALERRETKAKEKELQSQAIDQQKERIELLKLTKRKKAEIKRRLAEVKRGNADIKEVEEIIDQYDTNESSPLKEEMEAQEVESEPEPEPEVPEKTEEEQEQEIESIKLKIQEIKKEQEPIIIADPIVEYEKHFKETAEAIMNDLPKESKELFEEQLHHFNPKLDIEENIKNMILKINSRVSEKVKLVEKVLKTVEKCEAEELTANTNEMTDIKKGFVKQKLSQLYSLR
jgi:unconventional prefoldin RPB5 interactor 1